MSSMTQMQQQMMLVEQLRREASFQRVPVSRAIEDLKNYVLQHQQEDCLIMGFTSQKANP